MIKRLMVIGAHPDDCELIAGGLTAKLKKEIPDSAVKYISMTNGDAGHQTLFGERIAKIRYAETREVAETLGIEYEVFDNHDGKLSVTVGQREKLIGRIREFAPDVIVTHYANDYHPDHRATHTMVNDCMYLLGVPGIVPDVKVLRYMPSLWYELTPDATGDKIFCDIGKYIIDKARAAICNESQYFDWLPWIDGDDISDIDGTYESKLKYMINKTERAAGECCKQYQRAATDFFVCRPDYIEAFEVCKYAAFPDEDTLKYLKSN